MEELSLDNCHFRGEAKKKLKNHDNRMVPAYFNNTINTINNFFANRDNNDSN